MADQLSYLFSTRTSKGLAEKIAAHYGQEMGKINFQEFSDGEFEPVLDQSVRGGRVFLIGSTFPPADNLLELLLMIDAAKRASAKTLPSLFLTLDLPDRTERTSRAHQSGQN